jgi:hypothetical protein
MGILEDLFRKDAVWLKGVAILGRDPSEWRMDAYGGIMRYAEYGRTSIFRRNSVALEFEGTENRGLPCTRRTRQDVSLHSITERYKSIVG